MNLITNMNNKYSDSPNYNAIRIVIIHWIRPSIEARRQKSASKIARWWIRICGTNRGFKLYRPYKESWDSYPPGLWRQAALCRNVGYKCKRKFCRIFHLRWEKEKIKKSIVTLDIYKYAAENEHNYYRLEEKYPEDRLNHYYQGWCESSCACNLMPAEIIINFDKKYNSIHHIFRIMAGDNLTSRTRCQISRYLHEKLSPKKTNNM